MLGCLNPNLGKIWTNPNVGFKGYSTFFGNRLILQLPQSETGEFHHFRKHSADFLIIRRISVTRKFLVSLTSIVGNKYILHSKNAGLFQPNFGSNMDKPKGWVKNVIKKCNPMAGFVHI